jgi:hypothetical protein
LTGGWGVPQREQLVTQVVPDCQQNFRLYFLELAVPVSVEVCVVNCATIFRGMKQRKAQMIKARVSSKMKRGINDLANQRGESEAVIVREALSQYLRKSIIPFGTNSSHRPKKRN